MTAPHFDSPHATIWHGDCIDVMRELPDASVDAVCTDPPYGLEFMGKDWDSFKTGRAAAYSKGGDLNSDSSPLKAFQAWCEQWATEAYRVLKPGGHLLAFGGSRTWHRLTAGIEDAGFEIRDSIAWLYGSGFPKSLDVSKAIDRQLGNERPDRVTSLASPNVILSQVRKTDHPGTPIDTRAAAMVGWGTALKPAFEPIVVARKPLAGTVAANVLAHGTGALNVDATRIKHRSVADRAESEGKNRHATYGTEPGGNAVYGDFSMVPSRDYDGSAGRWPANVVLDESQAAALDAQSGERPSGIAVTRNGGGRGIFTGIGGKDLPGVPVPDSGYRDTGGASRFFYTAKASTDERPSVDGIAHPTVKPLDLMRWLVRLVTPKGGTVLEPFAGSGTTVEACLREGFRCIAIERESDYLPLIMQRVSKPHAVGLDFGDWEDAS